MLPLPASVEIFGVTLIGVNRDTGTKILFSLVLLAAVLLLRWLALALSRRLLPGRRQDSTRFWSRQGIQIAAAVVLVLGLLSIWITPGADLSVGIGLISAGLAFALQQVITAMAGYVVILRGDIFGVGDRITLGGVRGDVVRLGFIKTTVLEMGQPPAVSGAEPAAWVHSRQPTGRLVTVSNGQIFAQPVYNYTRDLPYIWEEIALPVAYEADRERAEAILMAAAQAEGTAPADIPEATRRRLCERYAIPESALEPEVYYRITDNWLELTVRFLVPDRGIREIKDRMSRRILTDLRAAGIEVASATYDVVGMPPLRLRLEDG